MKPEPTIDPYLLGVLISVVLGCAACSVNPSTPASPIGNVGGAGGTVSSPTGNTGGNAGTVPGPLGNTGGRGAAVSTPAGNVGGATGNTGGGAPGGAGGDAGAFTGTRTPLPTEGTQKVVPSEACSGVIAAPTDGEHALVVNGVARSFILHVPPSYPGQPPFPLLMAFHGKGDKAAGWDGYSFRLSELGGATNVLVYPQALPDPLLCNEPSFERNPAEDLVFVDALLVWLNTNVCFDKGRLFVVGHSLGSTFVQTLACRRGDALRAIATQAGDLGEMTNCVAKVPAWVGYGLTDSQNQVQASRTRSDFWRMQDGCDPASVVPGSPTPPCVTYTKCAPGFPVEICEDPAGTHKWGSWMTQSILDFFASFLPNP